MHDMPYSVGVVSRFAGVTVRPEEPTVGYQVN
jgi:hypothetical protein